MPFPAELADAAFLLRTGWTEEEYDNTSPAIITKMTIIMNAEAEVTRMKMQQAESKLRK